MIPWSYSNKKKASQIKTILMTAGGLVLIAITILLLFGVFSWAVSLIVLFFISIVLTWMLNFNFVRLFIENDKVIIRYYALFTIDRKYSSIEFPINSLEKVVVKQYFLGLKWDLQIAVRLKQGVAVYPPVSLSALSFNERKYLLTKLKQFEKII